MSMTFDPAEVSYLRWVIGSSYFEEIEKGSLTFALIEWPPGSQKFIQGLRAKTVGVKKTGWFVAPLSSLAAVGILEEKS